MSRAKTTNFQGIPTEWRIKPAADEKAPTSSEIRFTSAGSGDAVADRILSQPGVPPVLKISMSTGEAEVIPAASPDPVAAQSAAIAEGEPGVGRKLRASGLSLPLEIGSIALAQAACLVLLVASIFMPSQNSPTNWWPTLQVGSLAYAVPGVLHNWELFAAAAGFCLIPFLRGEKRSRLMFNVSLSILALMLLALVQQNMIGTDMIVLPAIGFLSLIILNALLAVRMLHPQSAALGRWQIWIAAAVAIFWVVPAIDSLGDQGLRAIFNVAPQYGSGLTIAFSIGSFAAFFSAILALFVPAKGFNHTVGIVARSLSACSTLILLGVGFLVSSQISRAFYPTANSPWFGVGLMWAFLLVSACGVLLWSGCVQRFAQVALTPHEETLTNPELVPLPV